MYEKQNRSPVNYIHFARAFYTSSYGFCSLCSELCGIYYPCGEANSIFGWDFFDCGVEEEKKEKIVDIYFCKYIPHLLIRVC